MTFCKLLALVIRELDLLHFNTKSHLKFFILKTMQTHAAVFRTGDVLKEGCDKMDALYQTLDDIKTFDRG